MALLQNEPLQWHNPALARARLVRWAGLLLLVVLLYALRLVVRYSADSKWDDPSRYEQVVWLKKWWGGEPDTLRVWLSHLGRPTPRPETIITEITGIAQGGKELKLGELQSKYFQAYPALVSSSHLYFSLVPAQPYKLLTACFNALVQAGYASHHNGSILTPEVYSFDIVAELANTDQKFRRTYHFRSWSGLELALVWLSLGFGIFSLGGLVFQAGMAVKGDSRGLLQMGRFWYVKALNEVQLWLLREILCRRIAKSFKWVVAGLGMLAAMANLAGVSNVSTSAIGFFGAFAVIMQVMAESRSEQIQAVKNRIDEMQADLQKHNNLEIEKILEYRARLIQELEHLGEICKEIDPENLRKLENDSRAPFGRLRQEIKGHRRDFANAHRVEQKRRKELGKTLNGEIEAARRRVAEHILAYLKSDEFRAKLLHFSEETAEEEFKQKVPDPELVYEGKQFREKTTRRVIALLPEIKDESGEALLTLRIELKDDGFQLTNLIDGSHPHTLTLTLEKRGSDRRAVKFEVRVAPLFFKPETLPSVVEIPVSLTNPIPDYTEWFAPLPSSRQYLKSSQGK